MPIFLCRAVVTLGATDKSQPQTEMQAEHDLFESMGADLATRARRQRLARLATTLASAWTRGADRLSRPSRDAQQRKDLLERLEAMPAYMLKDIGVTRDQAGRFCHYNDYGMLVELAPEGQDPVRATGGRNVQTPILATAYAAQ